jgi:UMP-CMP kinase
LICLDVCLDHIYVIYLIFQQYYLAITSSSFAGSFISDPGIMSKCTSKVSAATLAIAAAISIGVVGITYFTYKQMSEKSKMKVVFVLGGPGSGKGTNCSKIVENFGYVHLSAGDLLREERNSGSVLAEMINTFIAEGKIVPAEITVRLLRAAMQKAGKTKFLVDGFPRDMDNLNCWESSMGDIADVQFLLFLDCPQAIMLDRLLERGKTSGRNDDNEESIKKRFKTYEDSTRPIIDHFRGMGKVRDVDSNRPLELVFADVSLHFQEA